MSLVEQSFGSSFANKEDPSGHYETYNYEAVGSRTALLGVSSSTSNSQNGMTANSDGGWARRWGVNFRVPQPFAFF